MHPLSIKLAAGDLPLPVDPWNPSMPELECLGAALNGPAPGGWVRNAGRSALIVGVQRGRVARLERGYAFDAVPGALAQLHRDALKVCDGPHSSRIPRSLALYHLGFQMIHPLRDGNGRAGRLLFALQASGSIGAPSPVILESLEAERSFYKDVFRVAQWAVRFELLEDLFGRILGLDVRASGPLESGLLDARHTDAKPLPTSVRIGDLIDDEVRRIFKTDWTVPAHA